MSFMLAKASEIARSPGDPKVIETGPSSLRAPDKVGRALGWFSFGLGLTELLAPKRITGMLGAEGHETLVRAMGAREIAAGVLCLSTNSDFGAWNRAAGDVLDLALLGAAYRDDNPKKRNVGLAIAVVAGCLIADSAAAQSIRNLHRRKGPARDYSDRTGFPKGIDYSRGKAAGRIPDDYKATPAAAAASKTTGETSPAAIDLDLEVAS
jgi:hypothetical protein